MTVAKIAIFFLLGLIASACQTTNNVVRIDNIPMYGQPGVERPAQLKEADQNFIKTAMATIQRHKPPASRRKASEEWFQVGESFMNERNVDFAMRRYNQSWLLDPDNYQPYWGFGRAMLGAKLFDRSIVNFERAISLLDNPKYEPALLIDTAAAYMSRGASRNKATNPSAAEDFKQANKLFAKVAKKYPTNANLNRWWAVALFVEKRYRDAWVQVKKTRGRKFIPFPEGFISDLTAKMAEPQ